MARSQYALPSEATGKPSKHDPRGLEPYIRETAQKHGVDPDIAVRVARSEGLRDFLGDNGKSGGAFQLYTGGGLGNKFQKETGLDPLDPKNEKATIDYAMQQASKGGWGPWYGAAKVGVGKWDGIGGGAQAAATEPATTDTGDKVAGTRTSTAAPDVAMDAAPAATGAFTSDFLTKLKDPRSGASEGLGEAIAGLGQAVTGSSKDMYAAAAPSRATTVAAPGLMTPQLVPTVDPRAVEGQRQQLALAMQRLNSGRLY